MPAFHVVNVRSSNANVHSFSRSWHSAGEVLAPRDGVGLGGRMFADRFNNQIAVLDAHVLFIEQIFLSGIQRQTDMEVAVGFAPNAIDYPRDNLALLANDQPIGVINVLPFDFETSATGGRGDFWNRCGGGWW